MLIFGLTWFGNNNLWLLLYSVEDKQKMKPMSCHQSHVLIDYIAHTGWGKIPSLLSVRHCEGRGGCRRVGLDSKGAGSWEVPVTTLRSCKDGVVQRAARICHWNLLFAKSLYCSGAACVPYSLPNPPLGPSTGPKIHSVVGWELQGNGKCVWKKMRTTTDLSNNREHWGCQTVRFAVSQALCTQTMATTCKIFFLRLCDLKLPML